MASAQGAVPSCTAMSCQQLGLMMQSWADEQAAALLTGRGDGEQAAPNVAGTAAAAQQREPRAPPAPAAAMAAMARRNFASFFGETNPRGGPGPGPPSRAPAAAAAHEPSRTGVIPQAQRCAGLAPCTAA